jgi:L-serine dehydratase
VSALPGLLDLFKVGIGPSSSHTMGPMSAAARFRDELAAVNGVARVRATLFGSLAWTGKGHATDRAIALGLAGDTPDTIDPDRVESCLAAITAARAITLDKRDIAFDPAVDILFDRTTPALVHPNTIGFAALDAGGAVLHAATFFSIGGGFVLREGETSIPEDTAVPYAPASTDELLALCADQELSIAAMVLANEDAIRPRAETLAALDRIAATMFACIDRGLAADGILPGALKVRRRAGGLWRAIAADRGRNAGPPHLALDCVSAFAIAVNEENACGGRVVTAPTNGAAGVVPAVLRYYRDYCPGASAQGIHGFLLTATAIGGLIKSRASISGAEVGCQGEVGSAAAMAAAGLAAALGGSPAQIENAAEIAIEHHLGMTCDPIGGLVQIPCIERNAFGAIKAITAASLALHGDGLHRVSLDQVIETMRQTGLDMQSKYKETSRGGLAVNVPEC